MDYNQIVHNTDALDDAMKAARDRDRMQAQAVLNGSRGTLLLKSVPVAAIAGLAFIGAASAAAWIMRPHFDFHTVNIDVPKLVEKPVEVPKLVEREVIIPKLVERPVEAATPPRGPTADAAPLPPKTPDRAEQKFIDRPDYRSAELKGRIVKSFDNGLHFDDGQSFVPSKMENGRAVRDATGQPVSDPTKMYESDPFIGDYGYCDLVPAETELYHCSVIHNDVVQAIPIRPRTWNDPPPAPKQSDAKPAPIQPEEKLQL
jgi:hypothetical protein